MEFLFNQYIAIAAYFISKRMLVILTYLLDYLIANFRFSFFVYKVVVIIFTLLSLVLFALLYYKNIDTLFEKKFLILSLLSLVLLGIIVILIPMFIGSNLNWQNLMLNRQFALMNTQYEGISKFLFNSIVVTIAFVSYFRKKESVTV